MHGLRAGKQDCAHPDSRPDSSERSLEPITHVRSRRDGEPRT